MKPPDELKIFINAKSAVKSMEAVTKAAEKLNVQLSKLQNIEIGVTVVECKKKWYQFWK